MIEQLCHTIKTIFRAPLVGLIGLAMAGCAGLVGMQARAASLPESGPPTPGPVRIDLKNTIELTADDPAQAVDQARDLAETYGGYVERSQTWLLNGRTAAEVTLQVPVEHYERLRAAVLELGELLGEMSESRRTYPEPGAAPRWWSLTVRFYPSGTPPQDSQTAGWDPQRTASRAFGVSFAIFSVAADALIWIIIVGGPFLVIGGLAWWLVRRRRGGAHRHPSAAEPGDPDR